MAEDSGDPAGSTQPEQAATPGVGADPMGADPIEAGPGGAAPGGADGAGADGAAADRSGTGPTESDQTDDLKARFRQAMAAKHGSSGAQHQTHGDQGSGGHTRRGGSTSRMFRRKSG